MKRKAKRKDRIAGAIIKMLREARPRELISPRQRHLQRRTAHLTQQEVAEKMDMDVSTLSKIERGLLKIELNFIEALTPTLGLTPMQQYLLLAVSGRFVVALIQFLNLSRRLKDLQDSFQEINLIEKNLGELEAMTRLKLQEACRIIYSGLMAEFGAGDAIACMSSLYELNRLLNSGHHLPLDLILGTVTVLITKAIPESNCSIYLFDSHKPHKLIMRATSDSNLAHHPPAPMTLNDGNLVSRAAKEGQTQLDSDPTGISYLIMPVLAFHPRHQRDQLLGVISTSVTTRTFAEGEIKFLETVCGLLAAHCRTDSNPKH